jgi:hypothetical protein
MTRNYAELRFALGTLGDAASWAEAGALYAKVAEMDPKGRRREDALSAAATVYQKAAGL